MSAFIAGTASYLPEGVVTNEEIAAGLGLDPEQIFKSSGIRRRRWAPSGTTTSSLAAAALRVAIEDAALNVDQIDYLLFGTMTPDRLIPGSATAIQNALGLREVPCLDIRAACCNALYGLDLARALVLSGSATNVAVCLAEVQSPFLDLSHEAGTLSMLFGDGAAALIVSKQPSVNASENHPNLEILDVLLASNGQYVDDLGVRCPGTEFGTASAHPAAKHLADYAPRMNGQSVILQASRRMVLACRSLLERNQLSAKDIRWLVPHQANANLLSQVARGLGLVRPECEVVSVLEDLGNTSSASMGIALESLRRAKRVKPDDYLLLPAFAAGFTWGAALCRSL